MPAQPGRHHHRVHAIALAALLFGPPAHAATIVVGAADGSCPGALFARIQSALDAAVPGDAVTVCAGTYAEQLLLTKRVRLRALAGAVLRPQGLVARTTSLRSGRPVAAGVTVRAPATIEGLAIDVTNHGIVGCDGSEPLLAGIFVRGVPVTILGASVQGARVASAPAGCANGVGMLVQGNGGSAQRVRIEGSTIATYQRAGIVLQDPGVRARVRQNLVIGDGSAAIHPQAGIEVTTGAAATIDENVVRAHTGASGAACTTDVGILLATPRLRVRRNQLESNAIGIRAMSRGHTLTDNTVDGGAVGITGILLEADEVRMVDNTVRSVAAAGIDLVGNRGRLRANRVGVVHATPLCDALRADPACAALLPRCGVGVWLRGRANRVLGTSVFDADVPVVDDGRANVVR
ncbi:MAG: right-handed parallel beta-helix repeat-containing protein [Candidatus Binatia bacterium]